MGREARDISGTVTLKEDVTLSDVVALFRFRLAPEQPSTLPFETTSWSVPDEWMLWGTASLELNGRELTYAFDGDWSWEDDDSIEAFLDDLAAHSAFGWVSFENEIEVFRGSDAIQIAQARVIWNFELLKYAQNNFNKSVELLKEVVLR